MFFKVFFAVVFCFALTSALPIIGGFGGSLPSPVGDTIKRISDLDSIIAQIPIRLPRLPTTPPATTFPSPA
ncbi:hypothetical protein GCK72_015968 [Caenorhabditis remanei]|uniref:Uncharacterized protein n=1 Tax=Caenorhabditis remanei TaxID=31234 RepID=A0A6A5GXU0_CAERE|nr:hypothetical protein GCK72_015968 [Caenorhabditis remanei]KAF1759501.1 hypothetical protein GCK72_015968 [Caenorhabditis remanei]